MQFPQTIGTGRGIRMKLLTLCVPCYNSQDYMERCIESLLPGGEQVEILIIDDGSTDRTSEIADRYEKEYPGICRAIHKANGGHGSGINTGIDEASGIFFKVVDSDDWLERDVYAEVLEKLNQLVRDKTRLDMMICNFTYMKEGKLRHKVMRYGLSLPSDRIFGWDKVGHFRKGEYILMHSVIYRTKLLRKCGMRLPEHCFYVDNLYVFEPLPYVKSMYYLNKNLYEYYIGREDQSVNQTVMISRLEQQVRVTKEMISYYTDPEEKRRMQRYRPLRKYMYNYLEVIVCISSILAIISKDPQNIEMKDELWHFIKESDPALYRRMRYGLLGSFVGSDTRVMMMLSTGIYHILQFVYNFN